MKKKYSWLINVAIICLCICAIAVGVYAANTATLQVSGTIGFTAHNCKVSVNGYIYGHGMKDGVDHIDGLPVAKPEKEDGSDRIMLSQSAVTIEGGVTPEADCKLSIGKRYFTDMASEDGKPNDIFVVIVVTNASPNFKVRATMDLSETATKFASGKIIATPYCNFSQVLETSGTNQTAEFVYKLELQKTGDTYADLNVDTTQISLKMNFEKYTTPTAQDYSHLTFGHYNDTAQTVNVTGFDNSIKSVIIPFEIKKGDIVYSVTRINDEAFASKSILVNISLPNTIVGINDYAFCHSTNLVGVFLPDSVGSFGEAAFHNCASLANLRLPNNEKFTKMAGTVFYNCTALTEITIPANIKVIGTICYDCTSLRTITCLATTPPFISTVVYNSPLEKIYVPSASVEAYKSANVWKDYASIIEGI